MPTDPRRRLPFLAGAWAALLLSPLPAAANVASADPFALITPMDSSELAELRGGYNAGNISVDFAVLRDVGAVLPNGESIGLQTRLAINDIGQVASYTSTSFSGPASSSTPSTASQPTITTSAAGVTTISAGSTTIMAAMAAPASASAATASASTAPAAASTGTTSAAANTSSGVVTPGNVISLSTGSGDTQLIQQISTNGIQTLVHNAASGTTVQASTTIDVTLGNILQKTQAFSAQLQAARMGAEAALAGLRH